MGDFMLCLRNAALSSISVALLATPALAQDYKWSGFSLYAGGGGLGLDADLSATDKTTYSAETTCETVTSTGFEGFLPCIELGPVSAANTNNLSASDFDTALFGTVGIGADFEFAPGFVVGAFADIDWSDAEVDLSSTAKSKFGPKNAFSSSTSLNANLEFDYSWTVGGRLGVLSLNRQALMYVLAGYTEMHADGSMKISSDTNGPFNSLFGDSATVKLPDDYQGYTLGAGTEVKLSQAWSLKLEGRYTNLNSEGGSYASASSTKTSLGRTEYGLGNDCGKLSKDCEAFLKTTTSSKGSFDIDPDIWTGRVALTYQLN